MLVKIVGAFFRPPAQKLIALLPAEQTLWLKPEPDNPFDPNAIKVVILTSEIAEELHPEIDSMMGGYGKDLENFLTQDEWHLGYLPKEIAKDLVDQFGDDAIEGKLCFDVKGKEMIRFDL